MGIRGMKGAKRMACGFLALCALSGCAAVKQKDREVLSDPILQVRPDDLGRQIEEENRSRREGSIGGGSAAGGGCGC
jgi:Domain of unknown function (DUF4266)